MRAKFPHKKRRKRLGRGPGSGHGKTSTRGVKGQNSRSGVSYRVDFEGGQNPLFRKTPKRGFNNAEFTRRFTVVNVDQLESLEVDEITPELLLENGLVKKINSGIKVLGNGEIRRAIVVKAHQFSESAKAKIEKAGGQAILVVASKKS